MTEEVHENVADEIQQEVVQPEQDAQNTEQEASQAPESQQAQESDKEYNFRRLREAKEQLERENRELREKSARYNQPKEPEPEEDYGFDDDDLVEGKVVKQLYKEVRNLRSSYEKEKLASIPDRLNSKFKDFEQVVTSENIEKLKTTEPELYASITSGSDLYAKGVSAYKTLKALGIAQPDEYKEQKEVAQQNAKKPISSQAIKGQGALADANIFAKGLTPELKKHLQQEMEEAAKAR
jgi:hypothetical protein